MALTALEIHLWKQLRDAGKVPANPAMLQFGEVNLYNSPNLEDAKKDFAQYARAGEVADVTSEMAAAVAAKDDFAAARAYYKALLHPVSVAVVDQSGSAEGMRQDLNEPLNLPFHHYDILINSGTSEHVFDQRQFWMSAHDHTKAGGLMFHAFPLWGWLGHGFYNYHPTFVADLAAANVYDVVLWWWVEFESGLFIPVKNEDDFTSIAARFGTRHNSMMFVVYRKPQEYKQFIVPTQGYYAGRLTAEQERQWQKGK